jgi:hypothetical protein
MLFFILFGLGHHESVDTYLRYPSGHLYPLAYEAQRLSPWVSDWESTMAVPVAFVTELTPAPHASDYGSTGDLMVAQVEPGVDELQLENLELRKRIEALENLVKQQIQQPPVAQPQPKPAANGMKSVPGWLVEIHDWNKDGRLSEDPLERVLTRSCPFKGDFRHKSNSSQYIYNYKAVYRVKEAGRYKFGFDLTCSYSHECGFQFSVDGQQLIKHQGVAEKNRLMNGVPLTVGDHTLEFKTWIDHSSFITYQPAERHQWQALVQAPSDFNPREYTTDELFAVVPEKTKSPVLGCNY